jgi:hypothetical protein
LFAELERESAGGPETIESEPLEEEPPTKIVEKPVREPPAKTQTSRDPQAEKVAAPAPPRRAEPEAG